MKWSTISIAAIALLVIGISFVSLYKANQPPPAVPIAFQPAERVLGSAIDPQEEAANFAVATSSGGGEANTPFLCADPKVAPFKCFQAYYQKLVRESGIDAAFTDLKRRYNTDPYVVSQCHPITHVIGGAASEKYVNVSEAFLHGDSFCWSGYYHGILEGFIARIGLQNLPQELESICAGIPGKQTYNFDYYNCVHGLGHGIMELQGDDVFGSLTTCDNLSGEWERLSCYSGVFMENIIVYGRDGSTQHLKTADPLYPCNAVDAKYQNPCYLGQTSFVLKLNGYDFAKAFALCATVEGPMRAICYQSMGRDAAGSVSDDPVRAKNNCWKTDDVDARKNCVIGAVKDIISYYHSMTQATVFCNLLDEDNTSLCISTGEYYFTAFK